MTDDGCDALAVHVRECEECQAAPPPVEQIRAVLSGGTIDIEPALLSQRVLIQLRPVLRRRAAVAFWKRLAAGIVLSLVPLPAVVAYDAYVLRAVYELVSGLLPETVAAYLVLSYAAFLLLLFSSTYAAVPVLLARRAPHSAAA